VKCESEELMLFSSDPVKGKEWERILQETIYKHLENRRTLRKESSARKPMRRPALRKLKAWGNEEELQLLRATKHIQIVSEKPKSPKVASSSNKPVTLVKKTSQMTPIKMNSETTPIKKTSGLRDCLTPPKKWFSSFSPSRKNRDNEVKENIDKKRNLENNNRDSNNIVQSYRPRSEAINASIRSRKSNKDSDNIVQSYRPRSEVINATIRSREINPYRPCSGIVNGSIRSNDDHVFVRPKSMVDRVRSEPKRDSRPISAKRASSNIDYCTIRKKVKEDTVGSTGLHSSYRLKNEVERRSLAHRGSYIGGTQPGTRYSGRRHGPSPLTISSKTQ
ncbi:unnamed protein product, partial [Meganyctiphanes norvegica]